MKQYITRWPVIALHKALEERSRRIGVVEPTDFNTVFESYSDKVIFTHVGLRDVNAALPGDPYENVRNVLDKNFNSILAPGFTDYFKTSRVYSKQYSRPKHGTFNSLFLDDADYRTDDACRSILVRGDYRFDGRDHHNTFSSNGCFAQLGEDDILLSSIGTPWLVCSFLHYLEWKNNVPYVIEETFGGVIFEDEVSRKIEQTTQYWDGFWRFNKLKFHWDAREHDLIDTYDLNGLRIFFVKLSELDDFVSNKLSSDPYYLVT